MIVVATPTRDSFHAGFTYDLIQLLKRSPEAEFATSLGTLLCNQRTELVRTALKVAASHILFIDSDMRFPPDTLIRLLAHNQAIAACNCAERGTGLETVRKEGDEVIAIGFGVTLISTDVFRVVPEPWFATPFDGQKFIGEDLFFCNKAREYGFKIFIDEELSKEIGHEGLKQYKIG